MGIWGSIAKGIVGALPIVGPIIQGGIEAVTAKKASDQQVKGGERAMAVQDQVYNDQKRLMQPYYQTGTAAFTTLGSLLGLPSAPAGGGTSQAPTAPSGLAPNTPWGGTVLDSMKNSGAITDPAIAPDASYGQHGDFIGGQTSQAERAAMPTASSYNSAQTYGSAPQATGMDMVTMQAPDGTRQQVPRSQAGHYTQMGAKVVG